jgi:hypothetical protein
MDKNCFGAQGGGEYSKGTAPDMPESNKGGCVVKGSVPKANSSKIMRGGSTAFAAQGGPAAITKGNGKAAITANPRSRSPKKK